MTQSNGLHLAFCVMHSAAGVLGFIWIFQFVFLTTPLFAGHSRSGYLDAGQSNNGRYVVTASRHDILDKKERRTDHRWTFTWRDRDTNETHHGELLGLRSGTSDVFDPVNAHIFVAPDGETFAVWIPQAMTRAPTKKPTSEDRDSSEFREFAGFARRLTIYRKSGEVVKQIDVKDMLNNKDWQWLHFYGCQVYWLVEYDKADTRRTPRSGYALYRISPDYTVLEFQIGANQEATHRAKQRGVIPPVPRTVRLSLIDGRTLNGESSDKNKIPVQPYVGELASKDNKQNGYIPSLDPVRTQGHFIEREKGNSPVSLGQSSPLINDATSQ